MRYTIKTPNPLFSGKRCGLHFKRGEATAEELTELQINAFKRLGYEVVEEKPKAKTAAPKAAKKSGE